jgi:hypothetical protein
MPQAYLYCCCAPLVPHGLGVPAEPLGDLTDVDQHVVCPEQVVPPPVDTPML